jgi:glycine cleavage system aminomethyltransferase T
VDDVLVYKNPDDFLVVVNAANREKDVAHFREHTQDLDERSRTSPTTGRCSLAGARGRSASWATSPRGPLVVEVLPVRGRGGGPDSTP